MRAVVRIRSGLPACTSPWGLMQDVGTGLGLADQEVPFLPRVWRCLLFNVILEESVTVKYLCLQVRAACAFRLLGI